MGGCVHWGCWEPRDVGLWHTDRFHPLEASSDSPAAARPLEVQRLCAWGAGLGALPTSSARVWVRATEALTSSGLPGKAQTC